MTVSGTPGTGTITLLAAAAGFQTFASAGVANGDVVSYVIEDGTNWEYGQGTYTSAGTTLSRSVQGSSAGGTTAISATSSALVFVSALVSDIVTPTSSETISGSKTFSSTIVSSTTPSSAWSIDCSGTSTGSIAASGTYTFQAGAGLITIQGVATSGAAAVFLIAASTSVLIAQSGTIWANTVTGGKFSLTISGTTAVLTNSTGGPETFQICGQRVRNVAN